MTEPPSSGLLEVLPELALLSDDDLRTRVANVWRTALSDGNFETYDSLPWWPPHEQRVGPVDGIEHIRDVTHCALAIAEALSNQRSTVNVDTDIVVAGALLHDVSKFFELTPTGFADEYEFVPHPYWSLHLLAAANLPLSIIHVVLTHSGRTDVAPATIEASIVAHADALAVESIYWRELGELTRADYNQIHK